MSRRAAMIIIYSGVCFINTFFCAMQSYGQTGAGSAPVTNQAACKKTYDSSAKGSKALQTIVAESKKGPQAPRVIGGSPASIEDNPWQVAVLAAQVPNNFSAQFCGGAIIAKRWVVTAAHCVDDGTKAADISILEGAASLKSNKSRVSADQIIVHCNWNPLDNDSDIALIHVTADLRSKSIDAIDSDEAGIAIGVLFRVSGWGLLSLENDTRTDSLHEFLNFVLG